jgi:hypothetical protein
MDFRACILLPTVSISTSRSTVYRIAPARPVTGRQKRGSPPARQGYSIVAHRLWTKRSIPTRATHTSAFSFWLWWRITKHLSTPHAPPIQSQAATPFFSNEHAVPFKVDGARLIRQGGMHKVGCTTVSKYQCSTGWAVQCYCILYVLHADTTVTTVQYW